MKKLLVVFIILFFVTLALLLKQSHSETNNTKTAVLSRETSNELHYNKILSSVTSQILTEQRVTALNQLDCTKITEIQFRFLGSTFMDMLFGDNYNTQKFTRDIDQQTLNQAYIRLGKYYLTCPNDWTSEFPSPQTQQAYGDTLNSQINKILQAQHVDSLDKLDCTKIPPFQLIQVGDARMDLMIGNEDVHAQIDKLIGERGLHNMKSTHILEGRYVLECAN